MSDDIRAWLKIPYKAYNRGNVPATILDNFVTISLVDRKNVPTNLKVPNSEKSLGRRPLAILKNKAEKYDNAAFTLMREDAEDLLLARKSLLLHGTIVYEDIFGVKYTYGFAWKYSRVDLAILREAQRFQMEEAGSQDTFDEWVHFSADDWRVEPGPESYFKRST